MFQQPPTAHAISQLTVGPDRQDIVVGLETGDLVYLDFINDRTERFNAAVRGEAVHEASRRDMAAAVCLAVTGGTRAAHTDAQTGDRADSRAR